MRVFVYLYIMSYILIYCIHTQGLEEGPDQYSGVKNGDINKTFVQLLTGHILRYTDYCLF